MHYQNGLEPPGLIGHFLAFPPEHFEPFPGDHGVPGFFADFDLLTTVDKQALQFIASIPGHRWWRRLLRWRTCFLGTTVTEYLPLPAGAVANSLPDGLLQAWGRQSRLLIVKDIPVSSHLLPAAQRDAADAVRESCRAQGFILVEGQALAYVPIDFANTDDYLARLSSGRRRDIRRKLRARERTQVEIVATGSPVFDDEAFLATLYELYEQVFAQSELHFDKLTLPFFRAVLQDAGLPGRVFLYRGPEGLIGFNLCFIHDGMLVDKFVGFRYPAAREHNLYFVSWIENLEYARSQGLAYYVAGWTDPEIKAYLGASFTFTQHAVYVRSGILRRVLKRLSHHFERDRAWFEGEAHA